MEDVTAPVVESPKASADAATDGAELEALLPVVTAMECHTEKTLQLPPMATTPAESKEEQTKAAVEKAHAAKEMGEVPNAQDVAAVTAEEDDVAAAAKVVPQAEEEAAA